MSQEYVLVSETINRFLPCFTKNSFNLKKSYTVVAATDPTNSWGKVSSVLSNFVLIDKQFLVSDVIEMVQTKLMELYQEHQHQQEYVRATKELISLLQMRARFFNIDQYAIQVLGKLKNRNEYFVNGWEHGDHLWGHQNRVNDVMNQFKHLQNYYFSSPYVLMLEKLYYMNFTIDTLMFTVNFLIVLVDIIMIYTLLISDIEERTYEFAMLRTLGFRKRSLVTLLTV